MGVAALAMVLAGCSAPEIEEPPPYAAAIEAAKANAPNEFLAGILEDGEITAAEYDETVSRYIDCVNAAFPQVDPPPAGAERGPDGLVQGFTFEGPDEVVRSPEAEAAQQTCLEENVGEVGLLYEGMASNPEGKTPFELAKDCLVEKGLVDESYTEQNWLADAWHDRGITGDDAPPESDATDADLASPDAAQCV